MPSTEPHRASPLSSVRIDGGEGAARRARSQVLAYLRPDVPEPRASDAVLIVSELVTNSVRHARVGVHQTLVLELTALDDRIRIAVIDAGSELEPRIVPACTTTAGGFGLRLVDRLALAWGVERDAAGSTRVWCELPLDGRVPPSVAEAV